MLDLIFEDAGIRKFGFGQVRARFDVGRKKRWHRHQGRIQPLLQIQKPDLDCSLA